MSKHTNITKAVLGFVSAFVAFVLLFIVWVYPEVVTAIYTVGGLLVVLLGILAWLNQKSLKTAVRTRTLRYGANAALTFGLVLGILVVVNFLNYNHFFRKDLTKDKVHSLSDQTIKMLKGLKHDVKFTAFVKSQTRDQLKNLFDNYQYFGGKHLSVEFIDPDRDPTRSKAANVKKYGTVIIEVGKKETRIEEANEEKLTNGLIKVLKEKNVEICFLTGHGEKSADLNEAEGYSQIKQEMTGQTYEVKTLSLLEEGKIPDSCRVLVVLGPNKAFFEKEITILKTWLENGGRALFALDPNLKGTAQGEAELLNLLGEWSIQVQHNLVIDPTSRLLGVNASVPVVALYNKEHPITKEFQLTTLFPLSSTVEIKPNAPATLRTWWLARTTPKAFAKDDFREISTGQVRLDEKKDKAGPHTLMVAVEGLRSGKDEKTSPARIIVMGTSQVATNSYARYGANQDLFLNAVSWLADDESMISIRSREEEAKIPSLTEVESRYIQLFTMILMPGTMVFAGAGVWYRRRKL